MGLARDHTFIIRRVKWKNFFIDPELCTVQYASSDRISKLGNWALLGKPDIKWAFRLSPFDPADFDLLVFSIDGLYYEDRCIPMSCSIS